MRRFFFILFAITLSFAAYGQQRGKVYYLDIDTIKGQDTVTLQLPKLTGFYSLSWEVYFDEVGGTSDGTGYLQAANDTGWAYVNSVDGTVTATPNDTITITNGLHQYYWLYGTPSVNHRIILYGTVGDTTRVISNYVIK